MAHYDEEDDDNLSSKKDNKKTNSKTPVLDSFGKNLTKLAEEGKLDLVYGRTDEVLRVAQILTRRKKNNPIIIGESGVGKTSIAILLAQMIADKTAPRSLFNKQIIEIDMGSVVSGTKFRGQFEERVKAIIQEVSSNPDIILFIDEIHTIIGAGGASGSLDAANMLKPALARGDFQIIGSTTLNEYRQHIEKDPALERRFQKVQLNPTSIEDTIKILNSIKDKYEDHHKVVYTNDSIEACVKLTDRYINDRFLPDKAIDALDEVGSKVHLNLTASDSIKKLEAKIFDIKKLKNDAVKSQKYEEAASLRDEEKQINIKLEVERKNLEIALYTNRIIITIEFSLTRFYGKRVKTAKSLLTFYNVQFQGFLFGLFYILRDIYHLLFLGLDDI
jgi:ATP-dependent Clp protease ATP-binding subunit ClpC